MKTVVSVCSARPNFVKLAAVHHALAARSSEFKHVIVHTGQHYDPLLSDVFFEQLRIAQPDFNLGVKGSTREEVIKNTESAFADVLPEINPDIVLVYGDVNGAVGAALATKEAGFRIGHVEAGLRSFDLDMPEEHNRKAIDEIADLLFCSESSGMENLEKEQIAGERFLVGNTMIDSLISQRKKLEYLSPTMQSQIEKLPGKKYAIATIHRPSNVDNPKVLLGVISFLGEVAKHCPITLPVHPRLKKALEQLDFNFFKEEGVPLLLTDPLPYLEFCNWMNHSAFIITDSGGIQEEATFLKKKCFTLRLNTERPSTVESGSNTLIDLAKEIDRQKVLDFAERPHQPSITVPAIWDGKAGERIVQILAERL